MAEVGELLRASELAMPVTRETVDLPAGAAPVVRVPSSPAVVPPSTGAIVEAGGERGKRGRVLIAAVGAIVILGGVGVLLFGGDSPTPTASGAASDPTTPAPPKPTAEAQVLVEVTSHPAGASVTRADSGASLGTTPWRQQLPPDQLPLALVVRADGHEPATATLTERAPVASVTLEESSPAAAEAASPSARAPKRSPKRSPDRAASTARTTAPANTEADSPAPPPRTKEPKAEERTGLLNPYGDGQ